MVFMADSTSALASSLSTFQSKVRLKRLWSLPYSTSSRSAPSTLKRRGSIWSANSTEKSTAVYPGWFSQTRTLGLWVWG